jgi:phytoene dehydrogenase-like protein
MTTHFDVIVVGGGLAGLAAGATAVAGGASTVVLEAHRGGGRARITEREGFIFNHGAHALFLGGAGMPVLHSLGVRPVGSKPPLRGYRLLVNGEQHLMPSDPTSLLRTTAVSGRAKMQLAKLLARLPALSPARLEGVSVAQLVAGWRLRPEAEAVIGALVRLSTYASDFDHFGADAAIKQLQIGAKHGVMYVDGGWAQLVDALARLVDVRTGVAVRRIEAGPERLAIHTDAGMLTARCVVLASGTPDAARALLPVDPGWGELGEPVTAACLDTAVDRVPHPGYVLGVDQPLYGATQSPPARQAPEGKAVVCVIRYGARSPAEDRPEMEDHLHQVGVAPDDVIFSRFLARMVVSGTLPRAELGGLRGRPPVGATGLPGVYVAGDWVGPDGMLADAALASGQAAARSALQRSAGSATMVA